MKTYILKRLGGILLTLLLVTVVVFLFIHMIPGDPIRLLAPEEAGEEVIAAVRAKHGLDKPLPIQYFKWMKGVLTGDLGTSLRTGQTVVSEIALRYSKTMRLAALSILWSTIAGMIVGTWAGTHMQKWQDYTGVTIAVIGQAVPSFWIGILLILLFGVQLKILPISGSDGWKTLVMPVLTMGISVFAVVTRYTRSSIIETMKEDYIRTARAKGLREIVVLWKHVFRNSMITVFTVVGLQFGYMLGGSVLVESVFGYNGIGSLLLSSINFRDYPVVQALVLLFSVHFVVINLLMDFLYVALNPEIRLQ